MLSMTLWKHATPFVTPNGTMIDGTEETFVERFANREGAGILANAGPQMVKGAFGPQKETVRFECSCTSTMAFFNSVAVGEEELINDVTETEAVRLDAVLHTFAK
ncbi:hypothetical protein T09_14429 [Trichinella sp. T9]|nr:hypothetical protein T09_14429 [Trichinella sp. T9]